MAPPSRLKCEPEGSPHHVAIKEEKGEKIECWAYQRSPARTAAVYGVGVLTCGLLFLVVFYWKPDWGLRLTHRTCPHQIADSLIIKDMFERKHRVDITHQHVETETNNCNNDEDISTTIINAVTRRNLTLDGSSSLKYFRFEKSKYIWDSEQQLYFKLRGLSHYVSCSEIHGRYSQGLSQRETHQRQRLFGLNEINVRVRPILILLLKEVLNPFYVFQLYTVIFWFYIQYIYYTVCIIIMSAISIAISLYTTRTESTKLRKMAKLEDTVLIIRPDGNEEKTSSLELVPGDVIRIPTHGCLMTCDAVLLAGNCVVNESMLTGESVPVTKTPLPNPRGAEQVYSMDGHKRHTLFCGTHVIQTRTHGGEVAKCVVVQTGFSTAKGQLVKSILYVKPAEIKLYRDTLRFVAILALLSFLGFIYTAVIMTLQGAAVKKTIIHALDIITIAVPPALPAVLTIGMVYAQLRLKKQHIYCISPQRINLCGTVDVVCFDKTGTLTEDGLDLLGVRAVTKARFNPVTSDVRSLPRESPVPIAMATCHELMEVEGEITGDPLDLKMFDATGWTLDVGDNITSSAPGVIAVARRRASDSAASTPCDESETKEPFTKVATLKIFPFASALQTMGVVVRDENTGKTYGVVKGSPEKVSALSRKETIPKDFQEVLDGYTHNGLRLLALAWKPMDISNDGIDDVNQLQRDSIECDMEFLGLMIMQNKLKQASAPAIHELNEANIKTVMVTGDNLNTAVNIGRECGIIPRGALVLRIEAEPPSMREAAKPKIVLTPLIEDTTETDLVVDLGIDDEMNQSAPCMASDQAREEERLLAMDGTTFGIIAKHYPHLMHKITAQGVVFARMSPDQKSQLVESLQSLGLSVGMCGDGANDCGALKQAHVGIALSQAEASVAAPFTSKTPTISCIPTVIKEGRCALVTSSCLFKFMAMYSLIMFSSVMVLTAVQYYVGDMQFFVIDIILCTSFVLTVGGNKAHQEISTKRPLNKLVVPSVVFALITQILLQLALQVSVMMLVRIQPWYEPSGLDPKDRNVVSYENTAVFVLANFLYLNCAFVYTPGPPYSTRFYKNIPLTITFLCGLFVCIGFLFGPPDKIIKAFEMIHIPSYTFKTILFAMAILHFGLAHFIEYLARSDVLMGLLMCRSCRKKPPATHQGVELQLLKKPLMELVTEI